MLKKEVYNDDLYSALISVKESLELDLCIQNFENFDIQSFAVNNMLDKHGLFYKYTS